MPPSAIAKQHTGKGVIQGFPLQNVINYTNSRISSDHGGVESTGIERRQQQLGRMADFPHPVTFSVFDLKNHAAPTDEFI